MRLSQIDIRELQKAKVAIREALDMLIDNLALQPSN